MCAQGTAGGEHDGKEVKEVDTMPKLSGGQALESFLVTDYTQKVGYLTSHFGRMWQRFNYFTVVESGLTGILFASGLDNLTSRGVFLALANTVISAVWYTLGAQDRFLVEIYRKQVKDAAARIMGNSPDMSLHMYTKSYRYIGEESNTAEDLLKDPESKQGRSYFRSVLSWRIEPLSPTRIAALFPLLLFFFWLTIFALISLGWITPPTTRKPGLLVVL